MRPEETSAHAASTPSSVDAATAADASRRIGEAGLRRGTAGARRPRDIGRRALLTGAAAAAGSAVVCLGPLWARAHILDGPREDDEGWGTGPEAAGTVFASFITDVHIDAVAAAQDIHLQLVLEDMRALNVPLVLHGGDITEFGSNAEYDRYLRLVPEDFPGEIQHVAGNHEMRWDPSGGNVYRARMHEEGSRSFDHQRIHVIMLEVSGPLQEEAHVSRATLEWLRTDLRMAGRTPSIIVMHCPPGADFHYVRGMDRLFALIADHPVRAILAGHNHSETVTRVDDTIVLTGRAVKSSPVHYLLRHSPTEEMDQLTVEAVSLPAPGDDGERTVTPVVTIPMGTPRASGHQAMPRRLSARAPGSAVHVSAHIGGEGALIAAAAQVWDESLYGLTEHGTWYDMSIDGTLLEARIDVASISPPVLPGTHRVRVRGTAADGGTWEAADELSTRGGPVRPLGTYEVDGAVTGAVVPTGEDTLLVSTDQGEVISFVLRGRSLRRQWRVETGPVRRPLALSPDARTAYVPSLDRALVALDISRGRELWRAELPERVASAPLVTTTDGLESVLISAGPTLSRVDEAGAVMWTAPIPVQSCGRPLVLGDTVVIGAGDGTARGYSLEQGAERWVAQLAPRATAYQRLLYGPWTTTVRPIGADAVLVGTVDTLHCLAVADGTTRWRAGASAMYTPPEILDDGTVLVVQERGQAALISPDDGTITPIGEGGQVSLDAGLAPVAGTHRAWHTSLTGVLSLIDADAPAVTALHQVTTSRVIATPAYLPVPGAVVVGDQDGMVRAFDVTEV